LAAVCAGVPSVVPGEDQQCVAARRFPAPGSDDRSTARRTRTVAGDLGSGALPRDSRVFSVVPDDPSPLRQSAWPIGDDGAARLHQRRGILPLHPGRPAAVRHAGGRDQPASIDSVPLLIGGPGARRHGSAHLLRGALSGPLWDAPRPSGDLTCAEVLAVAMPSRWIRAHTWTRRFGSAPKSWTPPRENRRKRHPDGVTKSGMADMNGDTVPIAGATDREGDRRRCSPIQRGRESWGHSAVGPSRSAQGRSRGFAQRFPSTSARIPFSVLARQRPSIAVGSSP
jgi:hypothetical protein